MSMSMDMAAPKRGGGIAGALGGMLGGGGGPEEGALAAQSLPEPEHAAAPEQLAYGDLRMPGPKDSRRGSLVGIRRFQPRESERGVDAERVDEVAAQELDAADRKRCATGALRTVAGGESTFRDGEPVEAAISGRF